MSDKVINQETMSQADKSASRWLVWAVALSVLALAGTYIVDRLLQPKDFRFERMVIAGAPEHVNVRQLHQALKTTLGGNYFSVDLQKVEAVAAGFPWIEHVSVRRKWPNTLLVNVAEYQVVAQWGDSLWLTANGEVVALNVETQLARPKLMGPEQKSALVWASFQKWDKAFHKVGLGLSGLELSSGHIWKGQLQSLGRAKRDDSAETVAQFDSFNINLLQSNADQQIEAFIRSLTSSLIDRLSLIATVDLRYHHGFAVRWKTAPIDRNATSKQIEQRMNSTPS